MAIIYLDPDDEITSAAARIRATSDERVALVLPYGSRLATSRINFRLLAREAAEHERTIEIVAADASARALAGSAGLVTHPSVAAFESATDGPPGAGGDGPSGAGGDEGGGRADEAVGRGGRGGASGTPPSGDVPRREIRAPREASPAVPVVGRQRWSRGRRALAVTAIVVALAVAGTALGAFLLLPSASVVLVPKSEAIGPLSFDVTADPSITAPDPVGLRVPAKTFTFEVQAADTFKATGKKTADTPAAGSVTLTNCDYQHDARVPAGARVSTTDGIEFETLADLSIVRATLGIDKGSIVVQCKTGSIGISALQPGPSGNVPANSIRRIDKSYGVNPVLLVTNPADTTGGSHTETPQVSQADVDAAMATLRTKLADALDAKIAAPTGVPAGTKLFAETKRLGDATPTVDPTTLVNKEAPDFELGLAASGTALGVDPSPISTIAADRLSDKVKSGWRLVEGSTRIDVGEGIVAGTSITFPTTVRARETRVVDRAAILARIKGLGLPQARTVLADYGEATVTAWPDWVTAIPTSEGRVTLTIEPGEGGAGASGTPGTSGTAGASGVPGASGTR